MTEDALQAQVTYNYAKDITRVSFSGLRSDGETYLHGTYMTGSDAGKLVRFIQSEEVLFSRFMDFDSEWTDGILDQCGQFQRTDDRDPR